MFQLISLFAIYGVMMFIWTFVYLNRSHDQVNRSFLIFLSNILVWMVLNNLNDFGDGTVVTLATKTVYWLSMMYLSITFLYFTYRLLQRKIDWLFDTALALNTLMAVLRYCYPIDYSDPTFWRMDDAVAAPLMSLSFSLPAIYALYLVLRQVISTKDKRQRAQLNYILYGIGLIEGAAPLELLLEKADRAMYASKNKGKNRTMVFRESEADSAFHMSLS